MNEENPEIEFQNLLAAKIKERGLTIARLSDLSGIAVKHLQNMSAGRFDYLPAAPYLRGYLVKLGRILDFDGEAWWEKFKTHGLIRGSGSTDELPKNRFARRPISKKIWAGIVVLAAIFYLGFRFSKILGRPTLRITYPDRDLLVVQSNEFLVQGEVRDAYELLINGESVPFDESGLWQKTISLAPGPNDVRITAKKFLGRETEVIRRIVLMEPPDGELIPAPSATVPVFPPPEGLGP